MAHSNDGLQEMRSHLSGISGVRAIMELEVWCFEVPQMHVKILVDASANVAHTLSSINAIAHNIYGIRKCTVQIVKIQPP